MGKLKNFILEHWIFSVFLAYSLLCLGSVFVTHPIYLSQKDNVAYLSGTAIEIKKLTNYDVNDIRNPSDPNSIEITYKCHFSGPDYLNVSNNVGSTGYQPVKADCGILSYIYKTDITQVNVDPTYSRDFNVVLSLDKNSEHFNELWNSFINTAQCNITFTKASITVSAGSWFFFLFYIPTYFGAVPLLGAVFGGFVVGVIWLFSRGYSALPWFVKFGLWVIAWPILIFFLGSFTPGATDSAYNSRNEVVDSKGKRIGYFDKKERVVRSNSGSIIAPTFDSKDKSDSKKK